MLNDRSVTIANPTTWPVTLAEAKKQVELGSDDDSHDSHLDLLIEYATELVETDANELAVARVVTEKLCTFPGETIKLRWGPVNSITSITYYDSADSSQTYSSTNYTLDADRRLVWLKQNSTWPTVYDRWDAITVTYNAGYSRCPALLKQCMLLQIGYGFENRDMLKNELIFNRRAYEDLMARRLRSTYP